MDTNNLGQPGIGNLPQHSQFFRGPIASAAVFDYGRQTQLGSLGPDHMLAFAGHLGHLPVGEFTQLGKFAFPPPQLSILVVIGRLGLTQSHP